jgi:serine/threonine protein kinase
MDDRLNDDIELGAALLSLGLVNPVDLLKAFQAGHRDGVGLESALVDVGAARPGELEQIRQARAAGRASATDFLPVPARRYNHERPLGEGGMGLVSQVRDRALGRSVALKQLSAKVGSDDESVGTLLTEARIAGKLEHPNIMPIYDVGALPTGEPYYTMRLMDTLSLADILALLREGNPEASRQYPLVRRMRIFLQVCYAVDYAHGEGVIHRDLKPDNVRVGRHGEAQLCDWGLARAEGLPDLPLRKALQDALARGERNPCVVIGSPNYMSPEQAMGKNDEVGTASDIYGLGAILYELLTLAPPVQGSDTAVIFEKVERGDIVPPKMRAPERRIPDELADLCWSCMAMNREDRPPDARVLCRVVESWLDGYRDRERAAERAFAETQRGSRFADAYSRLRATRHRSADRPASHGDDLTDHDPDGREHEITAAFFQAHDAYTRALGFYPGDLVARAKLAELALAHLEDSEARDDDLGCQFAWYLLRRNNDGAFDALTEGTARLEVQTEPNGATIWIRALTQDGRFGTSPKAIGHAPVAVDDLDAGLYLVTAEHPTGLRTSRPIFLRSRSTRALRLQLDR